MKMINQILYGVAFIAGHMQPSAHLGSKLSERYECLKMIKAELARYNFHLLCCYYFPWSTGWEYVSSRPPQRSSKRALSLFFGISSNLFRVILASKAPCTCAIQVLSVKPLLGCACFCFLYDTRLVGSQEWCVCFSKVYNAVVMLVVWEIVTTGKRKMILKLHFGEYSVPITWDMLTQNPQKLLLLTPDYEGVLKRQLH